MPASKGALVKTTDAHPPPPKESRKQGRPFGHRSGALDLIELSIKLQKYDKSWIKI